MTPERNTKNIGGGVDNDARDDESSDRITNGLRSIYVDSALDAIVPESVVSSDAP